MRYVTTAAVVLLLTALSLAQSNNPCGGLQGNDEQDGGGVQGQTIFNQLQQTAGWGTTKNFGGGNDTGNCWMEQFQSHPSLSGASTELWNSNGTFGSNSSSNGLLYRKLDVDGGGLYDSVQGLTSDFYFMVDSNAQTYGRALEFDAFQYGPSGYRYQMGSQCDIYDGVWQLWNQSANSGAGGWVSQTQNMPPCTNTTFTPYVWYHVTWVLTTDHSNNTYTFCSLKINGISLLSSPVQYTATNRSVPDNLGVDFQIDTNGTNINNATPQFREWFDSVTFTTTTVSGCPG